jgi:hypothetical protein
VAGGAQLVDPVDNLIRAGLGGTESGLERSDDDALGVGGESGGDGEQGDDQDGPDEVAAHGGPSMARRLR